MLFPKIFVHVNQVSNMLMKMPRKNEDLLLQV